MRWCQKYTKQGIIDLEFYHSEQEESFHFETDGLVLCTGYKYRLPAFLDGINDRIDWKSTEKFNVQRNYSIDKMLMRSLFRMQNWKLMAL